MRQFLICILGNACLNGSLSGALVENGQHLGKHRGNGIARATDKIGNRGEVRLGIARQGNKQHVVAAGTLDALVSLSL